MRVVLFSHAGDSWVLPLWEYLSRGHEVCGPLSFGTVPSILADAAIGLIPAQQETSVYWEQLLCHVVTQHIPVLLLDFSGTLRADLVFLSQKLPQGVRYDLARELSFYDQAHHFLASVERGCGLASSLAGFRHVTAHVG